MIELEERDVVFGAKGSHECSPPPRDEDGSIVDWGAPVSCHINSAQCPDSVDVDVIGYGRLQRSYLGCCVGVGGNSEATMCKYEFGYFITV
jgi:hypothetical protein